MALYPDGTLVEEGSAMLFDMTNNDEHRDRNGTEKHEDRGQGEGHQQIGNQQEPSGGARYRDDATPPNEQGGPGNERNQGQGNPGGGNGRGQGSGKAGESNDT